MSEQKNMALYQNWPKRVSRVYGVVDVSMPALHVQVFPANMAGLTKAISTASRADAKLVKLPKQFFCSYKLEEFVKLQVKNGTYVPVYKATLTLPQGEEE